MDYFFGTLVRLMDPPLSNAMLKHIKLNRYKGKGQGKKNIRYRSQCKGEERERVNKR